MTSDADCALSKARNLVIDDSNTPIMFRWAQAVINFHPHPTKKIVDPSARPVDYDGDRTPHINNDIDWVYAHLEAATPLAKDWLDESELLISKATNMAEL